MAVRVHLADDHTMFRQGLEAILSSHEGVEIVGSTSTGEDDAVALVGENKPYPASKKREEGYVLTNGSSRCRCGSCWRCCGCRGPLYWARAP